MRSRTALTGMALVLSTCATPATSQTTTSGLSTPTTQTGETPAATLESAREKWAEAGLADYHFVYENDCGECDPTYGAPRTVTVWDGEVHDPTLHAPSVEEAFQQIATAIESGAEVEVVYHPLLGYPTDLWIDREARAYDGGTHWIFGEVREGLPGSEDAIASLDAGWNLWKSTRPEAYEFQATLLCDCEAEARLWIRVSGDVVTDWRVEQSPRGPNGVTPITIDQMFADLAELVAAGGSIENAGLKLSGSAQYHPELGYPEWFGLDIEVLENGSMFGDLPPRLVFIVSDLAAITATEIGIDTNLEQARAGWVAIGFTDYAYELTVHDVESGSFSDGYLVEVRESTVVGVSQNGIPIEYGEIPAATIDDLFERIAFWIDEGSEVDVLYHDQLAYPVLVTVTSVDGSRTVISIANLTATG